MRIHGRCHCGNIAFDLDWMPEPSTIPARACTCSFCRKHGAAWTACPGGTLRVTVEDPALLTAYAFETRSADFHVCRRCGAVPLVTCRIDGRTYAVVNVNTFEGVPASMLSQSTVSFEGEDEQDRLARRRRNWIGQVEFEPAQGARDARR